MLFRFLIEKNGGCEVKLLELCVSVVFMVFLLYIIIVGYMLNCKENMFLYSFWYFWNFFIGCDLRNGRCLMIGSFYGLGGLWFYFRMILRVINIVYSIVIILIRFEVF